MILGLVGNNEWFTTFWVEFKNFHVQGLGLITATTSTENVLNRHFSCAQGTNSRLNFNSTTCLQCTIAMPILSRDQRQQALGRLQAGQRAAVIANDLVAPLGQ